MTVRHEGGTIWLEGDCRVEDAEPLAALLEADAGLTVDLERCRHLHAAVVQALLCYQPATKGDPADSFLRTWIVPGLRRQASKDRD